LDCRLPATAATAAATTTVATAAATTAAATTATAASAATASSTTAVAATAATAVAATTSAATLITRSGLARSSFVYGQSASVDFSVVLGVDGVVHLIGIDVDKAKASTFDDSRIGATELGKDCFELRFGS
jgi:hypothetical protein